MSQSLPEDTRGRRAAWMRWQTPEDRSPNNRAYLICKIAYLFGATVHGAWIILFFMLDISILGWFNVGSTLLFLFLLWLNERGHVLLTSTLALCEVVAHQACAVIFIGWDAGFQYYLGLSLMLPFLIQPTHLHLKIVFACLAAFTFIYLDMNWRKVEPIYQLSPLILTRLGIINTSLTALNIVTWTHIFNRNAERAKVLAMTERRKAERLLCNILPASVVERLKNNQEVIADHVDEATILFADLVDFTRVASEFAPRDLIELLNELFSRFDDLIESFGLEKIKTIGDAYMVASGVPDPRTDHAEVMARLALAMLDELRTYNQERGFQLDIRIGLHSGPVVGGVIGKKRLIYDLWGDTVNIAARFQAQATINGIHISEATRRYLGSEFLVAERGVFAVKGKGDMQSYSLEGRTAVQASDQTA
ncbi:MAG TPA: adenylate/guanylate cyclase domain-containing protein [Oligoflexus sp.]|uniref:adenylate/guanylate cyclase domain-containing protein n=1 Tax=Oligoflexus sp. TaxID=1971216 RepID=UPI002D80AC0F|nr:adenylate/guanylate cyclase domain-containing protein [Oligoflexus sp.]HET9237837.1 adenylate/guanylate cyclase domain-containing protein [Oligoflexus sp.]